MCVKVLISPHFECAHGLRGSDELGFYVVIVAEAVQNLQTKVLERAREGDIAIGNIDLGSFWEGIILGIFPSNAGTL